MATLVLTAVGGAIGGPIGAAIGATLGQGVDRELLKPKGRQGPRLSDLSVQTSRYGAQIPKVFGRMRVAGCVIWSTDLIESRATSGGKGQPSTTSYTYAASFAVALSARPIVRVERIWADGSLLRGAAGDWKATTGFRLHTGEETQTPDPLIASATAAGLAHRGIAYAVFENLQVAGYGNRIPSLTFEVIADEAPVRVGGIARALDDGVLSGDGPADALTGFSASGDSVRGAAEALADLSGGWFVPAGRAIRMANRIGAASALPADAEVTRRRRPIDAVPVALALSHHDPARDYQVGVQQARRPGAGWREDAVDAPASIEATAARALADAMLRRMDAARATMQVQTDVAAIGVRPGDAVTVAGAPGAWRVTRTTIEGMRVVLNLVRGPSSASAALPIADPGVVLPSPDRPIGRTLIALAELPPLGDTLPTVPHLSVFAAGGGDGWRAAALLLSRDAGASWTSMGATAAPGVLGTLDAALTRAPATLVDRAGVIEITLAHDGMALVSADDAALHRGVNLALVGDELLQFGRAVQVAPRRWRVDGLWRGRRGTAPTSHPPGARFLLVEPAMTRTIALPGAAPGERVLVMASGVGDDESPVIREAVLSGASVAPPAPVALRIDDGHVHWIRRSRQGWAWQDGVDTPLSEERERYRVRVTTPQSARELFTAAPFATLTQAERAMRPLMVAVCQYGTLALSSEATITLEEQP